MLLLLVLQLLQPAFATDHGITGRSTSGCGGCHGRTADSATTVTLAASASTVYPGDTVDVTLTVASSDASHTHAGLNASASSGTLASGSNNKLSSSEITHSAPQRMSSGSIVFEFQWTAPAAEGSYRISGAGNAVDDNATETGDGWNLASDLTLVVDDGCDDLDRDGITDCDGDCDDADGAVYPGADEHCDGVDEDCDGVADNAAVDATSWYGDADRDGYGDDATSYAACEAAPGDVAVGGDCDDAESATFPGAADAWYDGVDNDCAGNSDYDQDGDGVDAADPWSDGLDCDDTDGTAFPAADDAWYDGRDSDCAGNSDYDADRDGFDSASFGGTDCDDGAAAVYPGAPDAPDDGFVSDCALRPAGDADGDGFAAVSADGADCDDANSTVYPGAPDVWYDGVDANCDGANDFDQDGDSYTSDAWLDPAGARGTDCDDTAAQISPAGVETPYDGVDQDCTGADLTDVDGDGVDAIAAGGTDCDDADPRVTDCDTGGEDTGGSGGDDSGDVADSGDSAAPGDAQSGCGCGTGGSATGGSAGWLGLLLAAGLVRRRR